MGKIQANDEIRNSRTHTMKYQYPITNARRRPYIGPRQSSTGKNVATALVVTAIAFAALWPICWICCEIKKL